MSTLVLSWGFDRLPHPSARLAGTDEAERRVYDVSPNRSSGGYERVNR